MNWELLALVTPILIALIACMICLLIVRWDLDRRVRQLRFDVWCLLKVLNCNSLYPTKEDRDKEIDKFWKEWK